MNKNDIWAVMIKNSICVICWAALAIIFGKWWIALFGALFLTTYTTTGNVRKYYRICDGCGKHSEYYDNYNEALDGAVKAGWLHIVEGNKDYCPHCQLMGKVK